MTEAQLQGRVIWLARKNGCLVFHCSDSRKNVGDHGFPDLVIVGKRNTLFVELKSEDGQRSPNQCTWHYRLLAAGMYSTLWRPRDLPRIESALKEL